MNEKIYHLPVIFSVDETKPKDDRFLNVFIDVLHTGQNLNDSIFEKSVVDENIDTIKNTPILGFIELSGDGEKDFKGHEYIITKTDEEGITRKYIGSAYGIIPESCNPRWIMKMGDDGQEREYLRVDGLLWTKFSDSVEILKRDIEKGHSMELFPNNVEGYEDENGIFHFTKFSFDGCCILGDSKDPAMIGSCISLNEVQFTVSDFIKSIQEELNNKIATFTTQVNEEEKQGGIGTMPNTDFNQTVLEQFSDISNMVSQYETFKDRWGDDVPRYFLRDIQDDMVIVVDCQDNYNLYGFTFTMDGDKANIDFTNGNRMKTCYVKYEEGSTDLEGAFNFGEYIAKIEETAFNKISEAENKLAEAKEAKATAETDYENIKADYDEIKPKYDEFVKAEQERLDKEIEEQKDAEFARYDAVLGDNAEFTALKEKKAEMSVKEIESECAILYARKSLANANFSKNDNQSALGVMDNEDENDGFVVTKYGNIPVKH